MINILREGILYELNQIEGVAEVYDSVPKKLNGFPSIYFTFDRIESSVSDSAHNDRIYYFQINLFQEITTLGYRESEIKICELFNDIIDRFDNSDLGGLALSIDAVGGNIEPVETENGATLHGIVLLGIHVPFRLK